MVPILTQRSIRWRRQAEDRCGTCTPGAMSKASEVEMRRKALPGLGHPRNMCRICGQMGTSVRTVTDLLSNMITKRFCQSALHLRLLHRQMRAMTETADTELRPDAKSSQMEATGWLTWYTSSPSVKQSSKGGSVKLLPVALCSSTFLSKHPSSSLGTCRDCQNHHPLVS